MESSEKHAPTPRKWSMIVQNRNGNDTVQNAAKIKMGQIIQISTATDYIVLVLII